MGVQPRTAVLIAIACLLPLGVLVHERPASAKPAPGVLRAQAIEIVDTRGQVRAQINVSSGGEVIFRLRDATGAVRVKLGASADGSALLLLNEATEVGAHVLATRAKTALTLQRGEQRNVITP